MGKFIEVDRYVLITIDEHDLPVEPYVAEFCFNDLTHAIRHPLIGRTFEEFLSEPGRKPQCKIKVNEYPSENPMVMISDAD